MNIAFRKLNDSEDDYKMLYNWCKNEHVYEWFEQRILTLEEVRNKYKKKLLEKKQELLVIQNDSKDIGLVQLYKYDNSIDNKYINQFNNIYEYDIFIGDVSSLSKGIGSVVINNINDILFNEYKADAIILRPFKRNIRAIKCYEKCGFEIIDEYEDIDTVGNKEITMVMLRKEQ